MSAGVVPVSVEVVRVLVVVDSVIVVSVLSHTDIGCQCLWYRRHVVSVSIIVVTVPLSNKRAGDSAIGWGGKDSVSAG